MKKYYQFLMFLGQEKIDADTKLYAVYRESSLSVAQQLEIVVSGNTLIMSRNIERFNKDKIQFNLETVGELKNIIDKSEENTRNRVHDNTNSIVKSIDSEIILTFNEGNSFSGGYKVKDFHYQNGKVLLDVAR
jgi:hypothetical protein